MPGTAEEPQRREAAMIDEVLERVERREGVRRTLSGGGVLHIDRGLPFLLVHRAPADREDDGTDRLVSGEASYLLARRGEEEEAPELVRRLAKAGSAAYGAFLVLEVWSAEDAESRRFTIHAPPEGPAPETVEKLSAALEALGHAAPDTEVAVERGDDRQPPGLSPLLSIEESWQTEVLLLGLEVPPIFRDPDTGDVFPRFLRRLQHGLSRALRRAVHEFVRVQTNAEVENPLALGTRTLPRSVWEIDRALVEIERGFDLLLLTSPVNADAAWERFQEDGFSRNPEFHYRLLPIDPDLLKRRLFAIEVEKVDDPALAGLYQDKREELDTLLTMLGERGSPGFRHSSHRLYGTVDDGLLGVAEGLLDQVQPPGRWTGGWVDALAFRDAAEKELAHYRERYPALDREIQVRRDVTGLMVSSGNLLIGEKVRLRHDRVAPLIHHEVGTHVLTYVNGSAQPLEQLSLGLADYDELQEGLAVLSEYLVGGLDRLRMRLLAARVVAAHTVEAGADFVETFRLLTSRYGYSPSGAWHVTLRVHASGGFTRDLIYLRGLVDLMEFLREGGALRPLYVGKIARKHIPIVEELRHRDVLREPPLTPRFLEDGDALERLEAVRRGIGLTEMVCQPTG
jgi:uncharacterized protein (TIGR02421 family)